MSKKAKAKAPKKAARKPKDGEYWVVELNGQKEVVAVGDRYFYPCGDEQGWEIGRTDIGVKWVRRIRL